VKEVFRDPEANHVADDPRNILRGDGGRKSLVADDVEASLSTAGHPAAADPDTAGVSRCGELFGCRFERRGVRSLVRAGSLGKDEKSQLGFGLTGCVNTEFPGDLLINVFERRVFHIYAKSGRWQGAANRGQASTNRLNDKNEQMGSLEKKKKLNEDILLSSASASTSFGRILPVDEQLRVDSQLPGPDHEITRQAEGRIRETLNSDSETAASFG
jgi:hypothetical protein